METDKYFLDALRRVLTGLAIPVFVAGLDGTDRPVLTAYTAFKGTARRLRLEIASGLAAAKLGRPVQVRVREERGLMEAFHRRPTLHTSLVNSWQRQRRTRSRPARSGPLG